MDIYSDLVYSLDSQAGSKKEENTELQIRVLVA